MFPDSRSYVGYMVSLIDDKYLFTGGIIWFGSDGGDSFISALAEDNRLAVQSLAAFEEKLRSCGLHPKFITGHTGWADNMDFAFAHKDKLCSPIKKRVQTQLRYMMHTTSQMTWKRTRSKDFLPV